MSAGAKGRRLWAKEVVNKMQARVKARIGSSRKDAKVAKAQR